MVAKASTLSTSRKRSEYSQRESLCGMTAWERVLCFVVVELQRVYLRALVNVTAVYYFKKNLLISTTENSENFGFKICSNRWGCVTYGKYCMREGSGETHEGLQKDCHERNCLFLNGDGKYTHTYGQSIDLRVSPIHGQSLSSEANRHARHNTP